MPKYKDFFAKLKEQGKINLPEYEEYLKTVPDAEIPDAVVKAIEDNFMTKSRALADRSINNEIWGKALFPVDKEIEKITSILEPLDKDIVNDIRWAVKELSPGNPVPDTFKQLGIITSALPKVFNKLKTTAVPDEETKKKIQEYEKTIQGFTDQFANAEKEYKSNLKNVETEWENKFHDFRLGAELQSLGNKFTLAEAFEEIRPNITEVIMSKIRSSNNLKLGEKDGRPAVLVYDETGKPKFNGNTPVTVDLLLEEAYKPYLKKSESEAAGRRENPKTTTVVKPETPLIRRGAPTAVVQKAQ